ncbi:DUF3566 domain-containing protein [Kitasatospora sp. NPDC051914]|uniref:DUF3566 domain-containing protein n=1 Tax=Kitasatospora sp. NPDC051914 TaxID=3154945 RepID=UPI00344912B7
MSGATGGAGGAAGGAQGAAQGGAPYGGVPQPPAEHPAASTSLMPPVASAGQPGAGGPGFGAGGTPPGAPPAPASPPSAGGYSQPTTYAKGQPTPARGTRVPGGQSGSAARRPAAPGAGTGAAGGRVRKARLRIAKADPWSVMKVSFLLSLAVGVIIIVATAVLWIVLNMLGVFDSLGGTLKDVTGSDSSAGFDLMEYIGFGRVMVFTTLISIVDVVLMTALATLSAFIYNTAAGFTGGIELTLAEED